MTTVGVEQLGGRRSRNLRPCAARNRKLQAAGGTRVETSYDVGLPQVELAQAYSHARPARRSGSLGRPQAAELAAHERRPLHADALAAGEGQDFSAAWLSDQPKRERLACEAVAICEQNGHARRPRPHAYSRPRRGVLTRRLHEGSAVELLEEAFARYNRKENIVMAERVRARLAVAARWQRDPPRQAERPSTTRRTNRSDKQENQIGRDRPRSDGRLKIRCPPRGRAGSSPAPGI